MSSSAIKAGVAYYELSLKDGKLTKGLRAWKGKLKAFGASVKATGLKIVGLGAALEAPFAAAVGVFGNMSKEMAEASEKSGVAVESLSTLKYAAEQAGVGFDELQGGLKKMQQKLGEAEQGNGAAIDSFAKLGININNLRNLSPDKQFELIADKIAAIQDPALRTAETMAIFGKSGADLIPLLAQGAAGIEKYIARAKELGLQMSTADVEAGNAFQKSLRDVWDQVSMVAFQVGAALAPALKDLTARATEWLATAIKWIKSHREAIVTVAKVVAGIMAAGAALVVIGTLFTSAAAICGGMATALSFLGTLLGVAASAIGVVVSVVGALLSPIGLVGAAIIGLEAIIGVKTGAAANAMKFLGGAFNTLKSDAVTAFGGIKDALAAGDFKLAAQILWTTLRLEWTRGINWLDTQWIEFCGTFSDAWTKAVYFTASVFTEAWAGLQSIWEETVGVLCDGWSMFTGFIQSAWQTAIGFVAKGWARITSLFDGSDYGKIAADIDQESNAKLKAIEDKKNQEIFDRDKNRKANMAAIERDRVGTLAALQESKDAELAEHRKARADKEMALQQEITDLIAKRDGLVQKAADEKAGGAAGYRPGESGGGKAQQAHDGLVLLAKSVQAGTFAGATAGRQLGNTSAPVVNQLKQVNAHLAGMRHEQKHLVINGITFE